MANTDTGEVYSNRLGRANMQQPRERYLYILQHPDKPDVGKIGRTRRTLHQRLAEHNVRGLLREITLESGKPWKLMHYVPVKDACKAEAWVWNYLGVPKFNNIEFPLDAIMEAVRACKYLDKQKYAAMLLRDYDVSILLDSICIRRERKAAKPLKLGGRIQLIN